MIIDYCPNGDVGKLLDKFGRLDEKSAKFYICEIILAIETLHKKNVIFRDLKPDNVLLDIEGHAK